MGDGCVVRHAEVPAWSEVGEHTSLRRVAEVIQVVQYNTRQDNIRLGVVHKVCYAIFCQFWPPPLSHFVTHPGTPQKYVTHLGPHPRFLVGLVQKTQTKAQTKAPCTNSLSNVRGGFCPGVCQRVFCLEGFVQGGFCPFTLSDYICYNRKLNIT